MSYDVNANDGHGKSNVYCSAARGRLPIMTLPLSDVSLHH